MSASKKNPVLGIILIGGAIAAAYVALQDSPAPQSGAQPSGQKRISQTAPADLNDAASRRRLENSINSHIQMTNQKIEIEKEQIKVEANFTIPRVGEFVIQNPGDDPGFNQRSDKNELNAVRDLKRDTQLNMSANDIIQSEMAQTQTQSEYEQEYRKEYARQFVENARRNGYDVKLSEDFRVIGVRVLRGASSYRGNGESFR